MSGDAPSIEDVELLRAYEPVVRFNHGELFFPAAVEDYVECCELLEHVPGEGARTLADRGELSLELLAELGAAKAAPGQFLRFVDEPYSRWALARWRRRPGRPKFRRAGRLARVGVLSRVIDALMRVSLLFRGSVARGSQAAAEVRYREQMRTDHHPYYGRVVRSAGYVALQYWMFYAFNDWRSRVYGVNDHEADWEQVVVYLAEQPDGRSRRRGSCSPPMTRPATTCGAAGTIQTSPWSTTTIPWCSPASARTVAPTSAAST